MGELCVIVAKEASVVGMADKPEPSAARIPTDPQDEIPKVFTGTVVTAVGAII